MDQSRALTPRAERQAGFRAKQPFERTHARVGVMCDMLGVLRVRRFGACLPVVIERREIARLLPLIDSHSHSATGASLVASNRREVE